MQEEYQSPAIISEVAPLLSQPIPEDIDLHVIELDGVRYAVAVARADMLRLLHEKRKQMLWPRDVPNMKMTELDRQTKLDADTAILQRDYELLCRIEELIDSRISVCLALLK